MASRCNTALVEPPVAMTTAMAFSNALRVMIWLGRSWLAHGFGQDARGFGGAFELFSASSAAMVEE